MRSKKLLSAAGVLALSLLFIHGDVVTQAQTTGQLENTANVDSNSDVQPDVTARVARISYIKGSAQLLRASSSDWEDARLNIPLVEGDEVATSAGSRIELQFDSSTYVRIDERSSLRIVNLRNDGIALSLPQGTISVRLSEFDRDRAYFEVDAPGSTVAAQRSGVYRIDAGQPGDNEIRVSVTDAGEARVYSETSGFVLKDGRSARMTINGVNSGEWETANADLYSDDFGEWALERDAFVTRSLQNAAYGKYYDRDIYGAEDLNNYGEWIFTAKYGYVWRPFSSAISSYTAWSPYRYGEWRWVPPYGWTWINDEPWGWATYHYGRWFYDNGYWYWTPYGAYRSARSWWSPALVYITVYGGNICWYPLPYSYPYYNYNYYYYTSSGWPGHHHGGNGGGSGGSGGGGGGPTPTPTPPVVAGGPLTRPRGPKTPPLGTVPPTGVVTVPADQFGRRTGRTQVPPLSVANAVLSRVPAARPVEPMLPITPAQMDRRPQNTTRPATLAPENNRRTGAATRGLDAPLDTELRTTRILGGRAPLVPDRANPAAMPAPNSTRRTGAVERTPPVAPPNDTTRQPTPRAPVETNRTPENRTPPYVPPRQEPKQETPIMRQPPRYDPPPRQEPPTNRQPPPRQEPPTNRQPPPKQEPPTNRQPPPKQEPPAKPEAKPDKKPALAAYNSKLLNTVGG